MGSFYLLFISNNSVFYHIRNNIWLYTFSSIIFVFMLVIAIKVFVIDIYNISSSSMEKGVWVGDKIVMSKLHYGPRMPETPLEIPWLNLLIYLNKKGIKSDSAWWDYKRLDGFSQTKRNDINPLCIMI
ncbi:S26 family signal peptidase [Sinomicrobium sp. M5D2P17]